MKSTSFRFGLGLALIGLLPLLTARPAFAQTTVEMYEEASKDFQAADKKLNDVYKQLMGMLGDEGKKRLIVAQRAWIAFRDAQADFSAQDSAGGTMEKLEYVSAKTELTKERTEDLLQTLKALKNQ